MKKTLRKSQPGCSLQAALVILAKAGLPRPGTSDGGAKYVIKHDCDGRVSGVDVVLSDDLLGAVLSDMTE